MNRYFSLVAAILFSVASMAQNNDYLSKKEFQVEKKTIANGIDAARKAGLDAKRLVLKQAAISDSLIKLNAANEKMLAQTNDSLQKTAARFNDLQTRVDKKTSTSQNSLIIVVIIIAVLFLFLLVLIFYFKSKSDGKIRELNDENIKLGESVRQEVSQSKEHITKTASAMSLELHEHTANLAAKVEVTEERQRQFALELEDFVDKVVKDQKLQTSSLESRLIELKSALIDKNEHKSVHEKLETEIKNLRSLHVKDNEENRKAKQ